MNLHELVVSVKAALQVGQRKPEDIDVVITTELPYATCGQRPCTGVRSVSLGFDWEAGQFRITPNEKLMAVRHNVPQPVIVWHENYHCPKCEHMLSKGKAKKPSIRYCFHCGQAVKWDD